MKNRLVRGEVRDGLYQLNSVNFPSKQTFKNSATSALSSTIVHVCSSVSSSMFIKNESDVKLWHNHLGHLPISAMKNINYFSFEFFPKYSCVVCPLARQSKLLFPISNIKTKAILI